jgi:hypothetical protein
MASNRQTKANRRNAKLSTGPKTEAGKAKSRRNSFCHGLSRPIPSPTDSEVRAAALEGIAEPAELARARLDIARVYSARASLLEAFLDQPRANMAKALLGIGRYERMAFARQKRLLREARKRILWHDLDQAH